jgi:cytochrome c oxidase assembly protein Cox11
MHASQKQLFPMAVNLAVVLRLILLAFAKAPLHACFKEKKGREEVSTRYDG